MTLNNRATTLSRLERYDEARATYARALNMALKRDMKAFVQIIRNGLAEMDFRRGRYERALSAFSDLWKEAVRAGFDNEAVFAHLYVAECLGRLGRDAEMAESILTLRERSEAESVRAFSGDGRAVRLPRSGNARRGPRAGTFASTCRPRAAANRARTSASGSPPDRLSLTERKIGTCSATLRVAVFFRSGAE